MSRTAEEDMPEIRTMSNYTVELTRAAAAKGTGIAEEVGCEGIGLK